MTRTLSQRMMRKTPLEEVGKQIEEGDHLARSIGLFQLTMFGVGATIGTGIFFVLTTEVPEAGPSVVFAFVAAAVVAGLTALCYAELASSIPVAGSSYSYAYATLGEVFAMVVAACLLLEYGVSSAAVAAGRSTSTSCWTTCSASRSPTRCPTPPRRGASSTSRPWCLSSCACCC